MKRILVIGDVIADVYRDCTFKKMCPDAPTVRAIVEHSLEVLPGGAANVAVNLAALAPDVQVDLIGVMDSTLASIIKRASGNRVDMNYCELVGHNGGDLRKERVFLDGELLLRVDTHQRVNSFLAGQVESNLRQYMANHDPDLVVVSDYGSGTVNGRLGTMQMLSTFGPDLLVDTKEKDLSVFSGAGIIKINRKEWADVLMRDHTPQRNCKILIVTEGSLGAKLIMGDEHVTHELDTLAHSVKTVDVCGCGDTFLAGLAASIIRNGDPFVAAQFANAAAATVVTRPRTAIADLKQTLALLGREDK